MPNNAAIHPAAKALWFIENHFNKPITLADVARHAGVSRFHMTRVFETRMGMPVMSYVRRRRLAEAARRIVAGAPDILSVALDAGYASHEAFTRAFGVAFGVTPEAARKRPLSDFHLQEPILMDKVLLDTPSPHRLVVGRDMIVAGLSERFAASRTAAIPSLWRKFQPYFYEWTGRAPEPGVAYGVCYHQSDAALDYMAGVETREGDDLPEGFTRLRIAPQTYAVFPHRGHISGLRATWGAIWDKWLPESGLKVVHAPFFECYGADFDGGAGEGGLEIWISVEA